MEPDFPINQQIINKAVQNGFVQSAKDIKLGETLIHKKIKQNDPNKEDPRMSKKILNYPLHRSETPRVTLRNHPTISKKKKLYLFKRCRSFESSLRELGLWHEALEFERKEIECAKKRIEKHTQEK